VSEIKNIDLEFKADGEGKVSAVFSVFNTLDSDGDVVVPEAIKSGFKSGSVPMVWAHKWDMPIGKGAIKQDGDKATFEGEFFMDTESGKEAYNLVKAMGDLQQWSFGYRVNDSERGKFKSGDTDVDARYLKDLSVYEVSPVLVGANQDTYTMAIKSNKELLEEMASEKGVLGHSTFLENEESEEEVEEEKSGCDCNCSTPLVDNPSDEKSYGHCDYNKTGKCAKDMKKSDDEEVSEKGKPFSEEVKDVLAALKDLMTRTNAIAMLRAKDGRKIGVKATEALRTVQDDLQKPYDQDLLPSSHPLSSKKGNDEMKASFVRIGQSVSWSINKDPDPPSTVHGVVTSVNGKDKEATMLVWAINEDGSHKKTDRKVTMPISKLTIIKDITK